MIQPKKLKSSGGVRHARNFVCVQMRLAKRLFHSRYATTPRNC